MVALGGFSSSPTTLNCLPAPLLLIGSSSVSQGFLHGVTHNQRNSFFLSSWGTWVVHDFIIVLQFDTICSWPSVPTHAENINTVIFHLPHNLSWFFQLAALYVHARTLYIPWSDSGAAATSRFELLAEAGLDWCLLHRFVWDYPLIQGTEMEIVMETKWRLSQ